ncbi:hypothetical protein LWI29_018840 [Acer saccharum]|uniref:Uncharacterized protein n=1 Tax=Acer saccharum TaxID=4024 RepID=A0AA39RS84_ACESA|nr:hypothetical protein LWI29_018840 [Acer saccharum]
MIGIRVLNAYQLKDVLFNISPRRRYRPFPLAGIFLCGIIHVTVLTTTAAFLELEDGSFFPFVPRNRNRNCCPKFRVITIHQKSVET